jgi:hypothetical protein
MQNLTRFVVHRTLCRSSKIRNYWRLQVCLLMFSIMGPCVVGQSLQSWPEIDTYLQFNSNVRGSFFVALTRENAESSSGEIGPNIDFFFKPLVKLKRITVFELDQSKSRPVMLRLSYRYMPAVEGSTEHRAGVEATGRYPLIRGVLLSDRNRADLRYIDRVSSWRYRNRLTAERTLAIRGYHFSPYLRAEAFFDSRFSKWSRTALTVGATFPIGKRYELESYYEHQNDTAKSPNRQVDGMGYVLSMYF